MLSIIVLFSLIGFWNTPAQAGDGLLVTTDGCFNRTISTETNTYRLRMQIPTCTLTIENTSDTADTPIIVFENIDPDYVTVDNYDTAAGLEKTSNTLQFSKTIPPAGTETITVAPWHEYTDDFYFVALSDNQAQGTIEVNPVFETIIQQLNVVNPVFYTNSGDLVQGSSNRDTMEQMYDAVFDALDESLAPMYPIAGNHDYGPGLDVFADYFGVDDYDFDFANTHFTGVSTVGTSSRGEVDDDTFTWLDNTLTASSKTHSIVFFHHALVRPDWSSNTYCCYVLTEERDELARIVDIHNTDMTIAGHSHGYDYRLLTGADISTITNGFYQLITAGAGGDIAQPDGKHHFTIMHVTPDSIEHTVVVKSEFDTSVEYNNNSADSTTATAEVVNGAVADLPYLRLKFTLSNEYENYVVYNTDGEYITSTYAHTFDDNTDDHTVVYSEIDAPANSSIIYTVQPATQIHEDTVNTVNQTGEVSYDSFPSRTDTALPLTVVPSKDTTQISDITWGDETTNYAHAWLESAASKSVDTQYTITDLPSNRLFEVTVNDEMYTRLPTNTSGRLEFTYADNQKTRQFKITMLDTLLSDTVVTAPYTNGNPQIRRFNGDGTNLSNWFALDKNSTGSYSVALADVTGDRIQEIVVANGSDTGGAFAVYTANGDKLATANPFGQGYSGGIEVFHGDLTGDGSEEIIVIPKVGVVKIKIYKYRNQSDKLTLLDSISPYGGSYSSGVSVAIGNLNSSPAKEIVVMPHSSAAPILRAYKLNSKKQLQRLASSRLHSSYSYASVGIGELSGPNQPRVIVYLTEADAPNDLAIVYSLSSSRHLKQRAKTSIANDVSDEVRVHISNVDQSFTDDVILYSESNPLLELYNVTSKNSLKHRLTLYPFGKGYSGGLDVSAIDRDNNWDSEIVTSQLTGDSRVKIWNYRSAAKSLLSKASWNGYGSDFTGGTHLAK